MCRSRGHLDTRMGRSEISSSVPAVPLAFESRQRSALLEIRFRQLTWRGQLLKSGLHHPEPIVPVLKDRAAATGGCVLCSSAGLILHIFPH